MTFEPTSAYRYIANQFCFVPCEEGLAVFHSYGSDRQFLYTVRSAESLWTFLVADFSHAAAEREKVLAAEREARPTLDLNLDFKL